MPRDLFDRTSQSELKQQVVRAGAVAVPAQALKFGLRLTVMMILARLLAPEDFGVQGMVLVVTGFLGLFRDAGLSLATVQRDTITHEQTSTLFWINVALGSVLALGLAGLAPVLAAFYREPRLERVAVVSSLAFVFNGLAVQHQALLQRNLRFVALAGVEISAIVASAVVAIVMAALGFGYWALVGMSVSVPIATALGAWLAVPWLPGMPRRESGIKSMLHIGGTWTLIGLVVYISYNLEKVLLGRVWGAEALGLYGRAYQLVNLPTELFISAIGMVAVPALSRLQCDAERLRRTFLKCYALLLSVAIPVPFVCVVLAEEIIVVALGPKWLEAASILRALAPTVLAFALMNPFSWFLVSTARNRLSIGLALLVPPAVGAGTLAGLPYGPLGVAVGYSAGVSLVALPIIGLCRSAGDIPPTELWSVIRRPLWASLAASACGLALKIAISGAQPPLLTLIAACFTMFLVYGLTLLIVFDQKDYYMDIITSMFTSSRREATMAHRSPSPGRVPGLGR